jgi:hypothetical protein
VNHVPAVYQRDPGNLVDALPVTCRTVRRRLQKRSGTRFA